MLIKTCWTKDLIEKNTQPAEAVGATKCSQNSASRRAGVRVFSHSNDLESRIVVPHGTRIRAEVYNHVDFVWTTTRQRQDHNPTTTKGLRFALRPLWTSRHIGGSQQGHPRYTDAREGRPWVAHNTILITNLHHQMFFRRNNNIL